MVDKEVLGDMGEAVEELYWQLQQSLRDGSDEDDPMLELEVWWERFWWYVQCAKESAVEQGEAVDKAEGELVAWNWWAREYSLTPEQLMMWCSSSSGGNAENFQEERVQCAELVEVIPTDDGEPRRR